MRRNSLLAILGPVGASLLPALVAAHTNHSGILVVFSQRSEMNEANDTPNLVLINVHQHSLSLFSALCFCFCFSVLVTVALVSVSVSVCILPNPSEVALSLHLRGGG